MGTEFEFILRVVHLLVGFQFHCTYMIDPIRWNALPSMPQRDNTNDLYDIKIGLNNQRGSITDHPLPRLI